MALSGFRVGWMIADDVVMDAYFGAAVNLQGATSTLAQAAVKPAFCLLYTSTMLSGADAFRAAARAELARGAQFIKIGLTGGAASAHEGMADKQMTDEEIAAVVEVAHGAGKRVAAQMCIRDSGTPVRAHRGRQPVGLAGAAPDRRAFQHEVHASVFSHHPAAPRGGHRALHCALF